MKVDDKLEKRLDLAPNISGEIIAESPKGELVSLSSAQEEMEQDFRESRKTLQNVMKKLEDSLDGAINLAQEAESPRAYEVVATLGGTILQANKQFMELHKDRQQINRVERPAGDKQENHNHLHISAKELLEEIRRKDG